MEPFEGGAKGGGFAPDPDAINEIVLGTTRGGRRQAAPLQLAIVRELTEEDLPALREGAKVPGRVNLRTMRNSHHKLAQLLAVGHSETEASLLTGYSPSWISQLKGDLAFQSLMEYYQKNQQEIFVDVVERAKVLGLTALEELQERLEQAPEEFSKRELMEVVDLAVNKVGGGAGGRSGTGVIGGGGASPVNLQINFVAGAKPQPGLIEQSYIALGKAQ